METFEEIFIGILLAGYFIGFIVKNVLTVKRTKQAIKGKSAKVNLLIINSTILYILTYYCIFFNPDYLLWINILDVGSINLLGLVLIALAFAIGISTLFTMRDSWRVGIKPDQKTDLITNGLFKFSRNPYFLSYDLMFIGIFMVFPSLVHLIFCLTFIIVVHLIILDEEKHLIEQHGESYKNYKASVNRYFTLLLRNNI